MPVLIKRIYLMIIFLVLLLQCNTVKLEYNYPNGLSAKKQKELTSRVKEGKKLFRKNCETCHGITIKTKDSAIKLDLKKAGNYQNSFIKGDYKNHAFTQGLTDAQLTNILLFLAVVKLDH